MNLGKLAVLAAAGTLLAGSAMGADINRGKAVFDQWCAACHAPGTKDHPGTASLQFKYKGTKPAALEQRTDLTPSVIKYFVRHGFSVMAPFRKTEITDTQLDALAAYLSKGNK